MGVHLRLCGKCREVENWEVGLQRKHIGIGIEDAGGGYVARDEVFWSIEDVVW